VLTRDEAKRMTEQAQSFVCIPLVVEQPNDKIDTEINGLPDARIAPTAHGLSTWMPLVLKVLSQTGEPSRILGVLAKTAGWT
jgi:hypothetical protein